jgi:hypothetical protein
MTALKSHLMKANPAAQKNTSPWQRKKVSPYTRCFLTLPLPQVLVIGYILNQV